MFSQGYLFNLGFIINLIIFIIVLALEIFLVFMNKQYLHKNAHSILLNDAEIYDRKTMDKKSYFEKFDKKAIENRLSAFLNKLVKLLH